MPICPVCRTGYDASEIDCPECGESKPAKLKSPLAGARPVQHDLHISAFGFLCLQMAWIAAWIGALVSFGSGVLSFVSGEILSGLLDILIGTPITLGAAYGFGFLIALARQYR